MARSGPYGCVGFDGAVCELGTGSGDLGAVALGFEVAVGALHALELDALAAGITARDADAIAGVPDAAAGDPDSEAVAVGALDAVAATDAALGDEADDDGVPLGAALALGSADAADAPLSVGAADCVADAVIDGIGGVGGHGSGAVSLPAAKLPPDSTIAPSTSSGTRYGLRFA